MNVWQKHLERNWTAFDTYRVKIRIGKIAGGKPADPEIIRKWVEATCKKKTAEEREKIISAHLGTLDQVTEEKAESSSCVFARVDGELAIEGRQVKSMLKESGNIMKTIAPTGGVDSKGNAKIEKVANLKKKVSEQVFILEEYISLGVTEPHDRPERPIHVMTAQGPRTSIKRVEVVLGAVIEFTMKRRKGSGKDAVPEPVLMAILDYAQNMGLGSDRSQGMGTFEVLEVEKVQ